MGRGISDVQQGKNLSKNWTPGLPQPKVKQSISRKFPQKEESPSPAQSSQKVDATKIGTYTIWGTKTQTNDQNRSPLGVITINSFPLPQLANMQLTAAQKYWYYRDILGSGQIGWKVPEVSVGRSVESQNSLLLHLVLFSVFVKMEAIKKKMQVAIIIIILSIATAFIAQHHQHHHLSAVDEDWERQRLRPSRHLWGGLQGC